MWLFIPKACNTLWWVVKNSDPRVGCAFLKTRQVRNSSNRVQNWGQGLRYPAPMSLQSRL